MKEFLASFANPEFMPHGHCYYWRPDILWTHVISDIVIAAAYYAIPVVLAIFIIKQKKIIIFPEIFSLFIAFIFLCGTTHLVAIYVTWFPAYEQQGWLKAITALVSITTALVLIPKLPQLVAMPGIRDAYEKNLAALEEAEDEKQKMQAIYDATQGRESRIVDLKQEVNELLKAAGMPEKYKY